MGRGFTVDSSILLTMTMIFAGKETNKYQGGIKKITAIGKEAGDGKENLLIPSVLASIAC